MTLIFKTITVQNFRSYGDEAETYDFENGLTIINGKNGNGKTSIFLHGLIYALFGDGLNGEKVDKLINDVNNKNMLVTLELDANGDSYIIKRGRKKKVFEIFKNGILIPSISDKDDQNTLDREILKNISKNTFYKLFIIQANSKEISIFNMDQASRRSLLESLFDLTAYSEAKKQAFDMMQASKLSLTTNKNNLSIAEVNLDKSKTIIESTKELIEGKEDNIKTINIQISQNKQKDDDILSTLTKEISDIKSNLSQDIPNNQEELVNLKNTKKNVYDVLNTIKNDKTIFDGIVNKKTDSNNVELLNKNIMDLTLSLEQDKVNLTNKRKLLDVSSKTEVKSLIKQYNSDILKVKEHMKDIEIKLKNLNELKLSFEDCSDVKCINKGLQQLAGSTISPEDWTKVEAEMNKEIIMKETAIEKAEQKILEQEKIELIINNLSQNIKITEAKIKSDNDMLSKLLLDKENDKIILDKLFLNLSKINKGEITVETYIQISEDIIIALNNKLELSDKRILELETMIKKYDQEISLIKEKERVYESEKLRMLSNTKQEFENKEKIVKLNEYIADKTKYLNNIILDLNKYEKEVKQFLAIEKKLREEILVENEVHEFLKSEDLKYFIIRNSFPILKREFNAILNRFFPNGVQAEISEQFDIDIKVGGNYKDFNQFSEGEKKRLDLGFVFTLHKFLEQKNQIKTNILIMDELLDSALDADGMEAVMDYIYQAKKNKNVVIVTHKSDNIDFDRHFTVEKDGKFSKLIRQDYNTN